MTDGSAPHLPFGEALLVQNAGLLAALVGYVGVLAGLVVRGGASR